MVIAPAGVEGGLTRRAGRRAPPRYTLVCAWPTVFSIRISYPRVRAPLPFFGRNAATCAIIVPGRPDENQP